MTRSPYRGVVWARSWSSFVSDSSCVGLLVQGRKYIAQRTFTKQRRAGLDKESGMPRGGAGSITDLV